MANARQDLQMLTDAAQAAQELNESVVVQSQRNLPRGGGILSRRNVRPSQAEALDPDAHTPLMDLGEYVLNAVGISSPRQRIDVQEGLMAENEYRDTTAYALADAFGSIEKRGGVDGVEADMLNDAKMRATRDLANMNNPNPEIRAGARASIQGVFNTIDTINKAAYDRAGAYRDAATTRIQGLEDKWRGVQELYGSAAAMLNDQGAREGVNSELSLTQKQMLANAIGAGEFGQKGIEAPGVAIPFTNVNFPGVSFDPTDRVTVGAATALLEDQMRTSALAFKAHRANIIDVASKVGLRPIDDDGVLSFTEIPVTLFEPTIAKLNYKLSEGEPLGIRVGLPNKEDAYYSAVAAGETTAEGTRVWGEMMEDTTGLNPVEATGSVVQGIRNAPKAIEDYAKGPGVIAPFIQNLLGPKPGAADDQSRARRPHMKRPTNQ